MKIAVTYDNGQVYQHFGHTESFKIYDVEDGKVTCSEVVSADGQGHGAVAGFLAAKGIEAVICGGLGAGAQAALADAGIEVCSGVSGDADEAVQAYINGELISEGINCDHNDHDEEAGCGGCGGCGGGCGSCGGGCGGCGGGAPLFEGKNVGKTVRVHYRGTLNDGTQFDSSYDRDEPLEFICGAGMMILGFDKAVAELETGDEVDIHLMPEEAYGMPDPAYILKIEISQMPGSEELSVGEHVYLSNTMGQPIPVTVTEKDDKFITFDANHEMAGKELNFHIQVVDITD
ncbi:MAG: FKBP-type peptidyl-prolyl cis-trans isomerase [Parasporobacterium sp.]|nr:FKBP-type peptidyl-prolyl cis-trans isomerase [Parasporobacterium sp.]